MRRLKSINEVIFLDICFNVGYIFINSIFGVFENVFKEIFIKILPAPEPQMKEFLHPKDFLALPLGREGEQGLGVAGMREDIHRGK